MVSIEAPKLTKKTTSGARLERTATKSRVLKIPPGPRGRYRLAQLEDYTQILRRNFPWSPPIKLKINARASSEDIPGTWGFGLWNDPFSFSLGFGGGSRRFPALPNAVWFFFASSQNYLSFRNDIPAKGALAATFQAPHTPTPLLIPGVLALPLFAWYPTARFIRPLAAKIIKQDAAALHHNPTKWHTYQFTWKNKQVEFFLDGKSVFQTSVSPRAPLGFVIWIDNQYAAFPPKGGLRFGFLSNEESWIEFDGLEIHAS